MTHPALLALDWGTTNLRGYLLDANGNILASRAASQGIQSTTGQGYAETLQNHFGTWLEQYPQIAIVACGMIGSRQGWREAPYVECPANPAILAHQVIRIDDLAGRHCALIPGVKYAPENQAPDVMRGEETQLFGALALLGIQDGIFVLPGTHSKWIRVENGTIQSLRTYMTGELYALLSQHSILGKLFPPEAETTHPGFMQGLAQNQIHDGGLSHQIFSTRTLGLFEQISSQDLPGYLSGLLIGHEISDGLRWAGAHAITLVGAGTLTKLYRQALAAQSARPTIAPDDSVAYGLHLIAKEITW